MDWCTIVQIIHVTYVVIYNVSVLSKNSTKNPNQISLIALMEIKTKWYFFYSTNSNTINKYWNFEWNLWNLHDFLLKANELCNPNFWFIEMCSTLSISPYQYIYIIIE